MRETLGSNLSHQLNVDEEIKLLEGKISSLESRVSSQVIGRDKYFFLFFNFTNNEIFYREAVIQR